LNNYNLN